MLSYIKKNGFPATINMETIPDEDKKEHWNGWKTTVTDESKKVIGEFRHKDRHSRVLWADGFMAGVIFQNPEVIHLPDWIENYSGAQM